MQSVVNFGGEVAGHPEKVKPNLLPHACMVTQG